jgi:hypothetical protein
VRRSDDASLTAARNRADLNRLSAATPWRIPAASPGPGSDGRKDNNNGITGGTPLPAQESATSRARWAADPSNTDQHHRPTVTHRADPDA